MCNFEHSGISLLVMSSHLYMIVKLKFETAWLVNFLGSVCDKRMTHLFLKKKRINISHVICMFEVCKTAVMTGESVRVRREAGREPDPEVCQC